MGTVLAHHCRVAMALRLRLILARTCADAVGKLLWKRFNPAHDVENPGNKGPAGRLGDVGRPVGRLQPFSLLTVETIYLECEYCLTSLECISHCPNRRTFFAAFHSPQLGIGAISIIILHAGAGMKPRCEAEWIVSLYLDKRHLY
ncbi:hypothetical protein IWZ00DRAFT_517002 [Phyllosticta capitalensis]